MTAQQIISARYAMWNWAVNIGLGFTFPPIFYSALLDSLRLSYTPAYGYPETNLIWGPDSACFNVRTVLAHESFDQSDLISAEDSRPCNSGWIANNVRQVRVPLAGGEGNRS